MMACGGSGETPPSSGLEGTLPSREGAVPSETTANEGGAPQCASFDTRECVIDLGIVNGVHNCAKGTQICENGAWSTCAALDL
jgi:hypothetical protein